MDNNFSDNPWNSFCSNCVEEASENNFSYLKSVPYLFRKTDDLVHCNSCNILLNNKIVLTHAKLHSQNHEDVDSIYTLHAKLESDTIPNDCDTSGDVPKNVKSVSSKIPPKSKEKKRKSTVEKRIKIDNKNKDVVLIDEDVALNFVPKSTLNSVNPLKIKIQLQPKHEVSPINGNIFENLETFFPKNNFLNNASSNSGAGNRTAFIDLTGSSPKIEHRQKSTPQLVSIQKFTPLSTQDVYSTQSGCANRRPRIAPVTIQSNGPQLPSAANQTFSSPRRIPVPSLQLFRLPQVFQNLGTETNSGNVVRKKCVQVKSFRDTHAAQGSFIQSIDVSPRIMDDNQKSFQQVVIASGMFTEEEILKCKKPYLMRSTNNSGLMRSTSTQSVPNSVIHFIKNKPSNRSFSQLNHRMPSNATSQCFLPKQSKPIVNKTISRPPEVKTNNRNFKIKQHQNIVLSDEEFCIDSSHVCFTKSQTLSHSASTNHISSQYMEPNSELSTQLVNSSNDVNNLNNQFEDPDVHYLPPPEETITSLSWEI